MTFTELPAGCHRELAASYLLLDAFRTPLAALLGPYGLPPPALHLFRLSGARIRWPKRRGTLWVGLSPPSCSRWPCFFSLGSYFLGDTSDVLGDIKTLGIRAFGAGKPSRARAYVRVRTRSAPSLPPFRTPRTSHLGGSSARRPAGMGACADQTFSTASEASKVAEDTHGPSTRARCLANTGACAGSMPSTSSAASTVAAARVNRAQELVAHVCPRIAPAHARRWRLRAPPPSSDNRLLRLAATFLVYGVLTSPGVARLWPNGRPFTSRPTHVPVPPPHTSASLRRRSRLSPSLSTLSRAPALAASEPGDRSSARTRVSAPPLVPVPAPRRYAFLRRILYLIGDTPVVCSDFGAPGTR
ncbi:hypothetical protein VTO73DRAFT_13138 [Trametes versicolor]